MVKRDFHMHTTFCDGKSSAEEMVLAAIAKGLDVMGFSGHAYTSLDTTWCMSITMSTWSVSQGMEAP